MESFMVIVFFIVLIFLQMKKLMVKKKWGEIVVVLVLYSIGFTLSFLLTKGVEIPDPHKGIKYLIKLIPFI